MTNQQVWFKEGLRFSCTECGKCCTGSPGYVWITPEEIEAMANYLNMPLSEFCEHYIREINGAYALKERVVTYDCVFLEGTRCRVYPVRPKQCKTFPWWVQNLATPKDWEEAAKRCEGINHPNAKVIPVEEILSTVRGGDGILNKETRSGL